MTALGPRTEDDLVRFVDSVRAEAERRSELVGLLREDHPLYSGQSSAAVVRMRGWILQAFESVGLPDAALAYALEELENGRSAYLVAAAARAIRGASQPPADLAPLLDRALSTMSRHDDELRFDRYGAPATSTEERAEEPTSARAEIERTRAWLERAAKPASGCCAKRLARLAAESEASAVVDPPLDLELEDQDEMAVRFGDFFLSRPSVVAFFYTRCDNPDKCSLTVTKLGSLQRELAERGLSNRVRTAGITYDPGFDHGARLRTYGAARAVTYAEGHRLFRTPGGLEPLQRFFRLGVGFAGPVVNRHRIELFVLDAQARVAASFTQLAWSEEEVLSALAPLLAKEEIPERTVRDAP